MVISLKKFFSLSILTLSFAAFVSSVASAASNLSLLGINAQSGSYLVTGQCDPNSVLKINLGAETGSQEVDLTCPSTGMYLANLSNSGGLPWGLFTVTEYNQAQVEIQMASGSISTQNLPAAYSAYFTNVYVSGSSVYGSGVCSAGSTLKFTFQGQSTSSVCSGSGTFSKSFPIAAFSIAGQELDVGVGTTTGGSVQLYLPGSKVLTTAATVSGTNSITISGNCDPCAMLAIKVDGQTTNTYNISCGTSGTYSLNVALNPNHAMDIDVSEPGLMTVGTAGTAYTYGDVYALFSPPSSFLSINSAVVVSNSPGSPVSVSGNCAYLGDSIQASWNSASPSTIATCQFLNGSFGWSAVVPAPSGLGGTQSLEIQEVGNNPSPAWANVNLPSYFTASMAMNANGSATFSGGCDIGSTIHIQTPQTIGLVNCSAQQTWSSTSSFYGSYSVQEQEGMWSSSTITFQAVPPAGKSALAITTLSSGMLYTDRILFAGNCDPGTSLQYLMNSQVIGTDTCSSGQFNFSNSLSGVSPNQTVTMTVSEPGLASVSGSLQLGYAPIPYNQMPSPGDVVYLDCESATFQIDSIHSSKIDVKDLPFCREQEGYSNTQTFDCPAAGVDSGRITNYDTGSEQFRYFNSAWFVNFDAGNLQNVTTHFVGNVFDGTQPNASFGGTFYSGYGPQNDGPCHLTVYHFCDYANYNLQNLINDQTAVLNGAWDAYLTTKQLKNRELSIVKNHIRRLEEYMKNRHCGITAR